MLAEGGGRAAYGQRGFGHPVGAAHQEAGADAPFRGVFHPFQEVAAAIVGVEMHLLAAQHRAGGDAVGLQGVHQGVFVVLLRPLADGGVDFIVALLAAGQGGKGGVLGQVGARHQAAEGLPLVGVGYGEGQPLVVSGGGVGALGGAPGVAVADALAGAPVGDGVHQVLGEEHYAGLVHTDVHPLAASGAVAVAEGGADGEHSAPGGEEIDEGAAGFGGFVAGVAGDPAVAVGAFLGGGLGRVGGIGAGAVSVAGVGDHNDVGAQLAEVGVVQAPAAHYAGGEVFHYHIADGYQLAENPAAILLGQIQGQGAFAAVEELVGGGSVPPVLARIVVGEGAVEAAAAGDVGAARAFDFDDFGAEVGQLAAGVGEGENVGGIQHADSGQRQGGGHSVCCSASVPVGGRLKGCRRG